MGKAVYEAGKTVTFRLRKTDQELANYLNSLDKPTDALIEGITLKMKSDPDQAKRIGGTGDIASIVPLLQSMFQQMPTAKVDLASIGPIIEAAVLKANEPILNRLSSLEEAFKAQGSSQIHVINKEEAAASEQVSEATQRPSAIREEDELDVAKALDLLADF